MTHPEDLARRYIALWNDPDEASRQRRLAEDWLGEARYTDPVMAAAGQAGIAAMISAAKERFAGLDFTLVGQPDGHGAFVRFSWVLGGDAPVAAGTDVVRLEGGRIAEVIGFLDGPVR